MFVIVGDGGGELEGGGRAGKPEVEKSGAEAVSEDESIRVCELKEIWLLRSIVGIARLLQWVQWVQCTYKFFKQILC